MEPIMIQAILGDEKAGDEVQETVQNRVRDYIDKSTGVQTMLQMEYLVEMVKEFGLMPED